MDYLKHVLFAKGTCSLLVWSLRLFGASIQMTLKRGIHVTRGGPVTLTEKQQTRYRCQKQVVLSFLKLGVWGPWGASSPLRALGHRAERLSQKGGGWT